MYSTWTKRTLLITYLEMFPESYCPAYNSKLVPCYKGYCSAIFYLILQTEPACAIDLINRCFPEFVRVVRETYKGFLVSVYSCFQNFQNVPLFLRYSSIQSSSIRFL